MSERYVVRRTTETWPSKGTYRTGLADGKRTATLACPGCGEVASLSGHEIAANGDVTPSVVCPFECGFHEFITLAEWSGEAS